MTNANLHEQIIKRGSNHFKTDRRKKAQSETDCAFL